MKDKRNKRKYLFEYNVVKNASVIEYDFKKEKRECYTNFKINSIVKKNTCLSLIDFIALRL